MTDREINQRFSRLHNEIEISPRETKNGYIYHYTSPEELIGILSNKQLYATDLLYLNDAAEGSYVG